MLPMETTFSYPLCSICHSRPADKTNSHIIPSFFISMVSSVDNSYKRDKELLFTINEQFTSTFIGREVLPEQLEDSFDALSDERIDQMRQNVIAKDYVFCTHCEKRLGDYLESPYHAHILSGRRITSETAYFYWISVIWRVAMFDIQRIELPKAVVNSLGKRLDNYIRLKDKNADISYLMDNKPFTYKVLYNKNYSKRESGIIHLEYHKKSKVLLFVLGDVIFCASFAKHGFAHSSIPYGFDSVFDLAQENKGDSDEIILMVDDDVYEMIKRPFIERIINVRLANNKQTIIQIWKNLSCKDPRLSHINYPSEQFIQYVISEIYSDEIKDGERTTIRHFANCIKKGLSSIYGIEIED